MKVLILNLKKEPFYTMLNGLKDKEYRVDTSSRWMRSRLIDRKTGKPKEYDFVKIIYAYGKQQPYFIARYKGFEIAKKNYNVKYNNGFAVRVNRGNFRIKLGSVLRTGNIHQKEMF